MQHRSLALGSIRLGLRRNPVSLARLDEPLSALARLRGLVVIDEIQRRPDLFPVLRVLADRKPLPARFLILGSASPELLRQSSETLAGRLERDLPLLGIAIAPTALLRFWRMLAHCHGNIWNAAEPARSLGIRTDHDLDSHPKSGASWEGYAIEELLRASDPDRPTSGPPTRVPSSICSCSRENGGSGSRSNGRTRHE